MGGDDLFTVLLLNTQTGTTSEQTIRAGQGGTVSLGAELQPVAALPVVVRGTVGFKFVGTAADDANLYFTRVPLELVASVRHASGAHAGAGAVAHVFNRLRGDGLLRDTDFDPAVGVVVEAGWKALAVRYTVLTYRADTGDRFAASAPGLSATYRWTPGR